MGDNKPTTSSSSSSGGPLKPSFLSTPGEPPMKWEVWLRLFNDHLLAHNLENISDRRKVAILRSSLGAEGFRICSDLCPEDDLSFRDTVQRLGERFAPAPSQILARAQFNRRVQQPGEDVAQFATALRALATKCGYPERLTPELIRDRVVAGCREDKIRERLLQEPDSLTLDDALKLAQTYERATSEMKAVTEQSKPVIDKLSHANNNKRFGQSGPDPKARTRDSKPRSGRKCYCCGNSGHFAKHPDCPANGHTCTKCGKPGHFESVCISSKISGGQNNRQSGRSSRRDWRSKPNSRSSSRSSSADSEAPIGVINTAFDRSTPLQRLLCTVGGNDVELLVDTGAVASILNDATFQALRPRPDLKSTRLDLKSYTGQSIRILGQVHVPVSCGTQRVLSFPFIVVQHGDNLMGNNLLTALNFKIVQSDFATTSIAALQPTQESADLINEYPNLLLPPTTIKGAEHMPQVDPSVRPQCQHYRRVPIALEDQVRTELQRMEREGIIEKVDAAPWVSNMVVVRKPDGGVRICCDLSLVNKAIIADRYPLPTLEELTTDFAGARYFSKLDLKWGYLQVPLHVESRDLTGMVTPLGLYRWTRLPFGLSSAPSAFQKIIALIISKCDGAKNLLDDIAVWGKTKSEHDARLSRVLHKLDRYNVRLNPAKCLFGVREMDFIGHHFSADGVKPLQSNVEAIINAPQPATRKQLASFLGAAGYYMKFVPNFAEIARPLRGLMKDDAAWVWTHECETAFTELRSKIASPPVLAHFDCGSRTFVTSDASADAIGAVLSQSTEGIERPVAFASRALTPTERNYSATEREALAAIWACERWNFYLYGRRFTIRTDHQALTTLLTAKGVGRRPMRLMRWADRLLQYDFNVEHVPGKHNQVADMLSRHSAGPDSDSKADPGETAQLFTVFGSAQLAAVTPKELETATRADTILKQVAELAISGWPSSCPSAELEPYFKFRDELSTSAGTLYRGERAVIPTQLRSQVLQLAHEGHPGITRMKQRLRDTAWWPGLDHEVEQFVKTCTACIESNKSGTNLPTPPLQPIPYPSRPWQKIALDIVGELTGVPDQYRYLIVLIDLHSKWPEVRPTHTITTAAIRDFLAECFTRWGMPEEIITDNGRQFVSHEFDKFLQQHGIRHCRTALYHPQSNGAVERFNRVVKDCLKTARASETPPRDALRAMLAAYRATPHATTGLSPAELMLGRKLLLPLDILKSRPPKEVHFEAPTQRVRDKQLKQKRYADLHRRARPPQLKAGDWVRVRVQVRHSKLDKTWSEPQRIKQMLGPATALLQDGSRWNCKQLRLDRQPDPDDDGDGWDDLSPDVPGPGDKQPDVGAPAHQRPQRERRLPARFNDYELY